MNTFQQTVNIPKDRQLTLNVTLPDDVPTGRAEMLLILSPISKIFSAQSEGAPYLSSGAKRLGCMQGHGFVGKDVDIKAIGREEIIAMFEGDE
ncbi:MAG: hypothetical protein LBV76_03265 [Deltaproteobacteria bacterium]|jgi:hypothetical protein|nr:hypothetical protein [Deltaproteobacteria bacterium]